MCIRDSFYTKYGDGGVDLSPIADLTKTEVFALGAYLRVGDAILEAPPTDGLWGDNRSDEDQLGATYPELEWAMSWVALHDPLSSESPHHGEENLSQRQREILKIYRMHHFKNKHKMDPIPVCAIPDVVRFTST